MIIQVTEHFHDYQPQKYYVDTNGFKLPYTPVEKAILKACKKKAFSQEVYFDVTRKQDESDDPFWQEPYCPAAVKLPKTTVPEKHIDVTLYYDC